MLNDGIPSLQCKSPYPASIGCYAVQVWEVQNGTNKFTTCHLYLGGTEWYQQVYHMSLVFGRYRMVPTSLPHVTCIWEVQNGTNKFTTCHLYLGGTEWYQQVYHMSLVFGRYRMLITSLPYIPPVFRGYTMILTSLPYATRI